MIRILVREYVRQRPGPAAGPTEPHDDLAGLVVRVFLRYSPVELVWFLLKHVVVYGSVGQRSRFSPFQTGITGIASLVKESWVRLGRHFSNHGILRTPNWVLAPLQLSRGSLVGERGCATDPLHRPSYGYLENVDLLLTFTGIRGVVTGNTVAILHAVHALRCRELYFVDVPQ